MLQGSLALSVAPSDTGGRVGPIRRRDLGVLEHFPLISSRIPPCVQRGGGMLGGVHGCSQNTMWGGVHGRVQNTMWGLAQHR